MVTYEWNDTLLLEVILTIVLFLFLTHTHTQRQGALMVIILFWICEAEGMGLIKRLYLCPV